MLIKVCSDVIPNRCCSSQLSGTEKDQEDFVQGETDTWTVSQLEAAKVTGGCENQDLQVIYRFSKLSRIICDTIFYTHCFLSH